MEKYPINQDPKSELEEDNSNEVSRTAARIGRMTYKGELFAGPRRDNRVLEGYDFAEFWNAMPEGISDAERVEMFRTEHEHVSIPDFRQLYHVDIPDDLQAALQANFIKINYIIGGSCKLDNFSSSNGKRLSKEEQLDTFRANYPHLLIPDGLDVNSALEFIQLNYATSNDLSIAQTQFGIEDKTILDALRPDVFVSPTNIIESVGASVTSREKITKSIQKLNDEPDPVPYEREHQAWETNLIAATNIATNKLMASYSLAPVMIPPDRVHIMAQNKEATIGGEYRAYYGDITVLEADNEIDFAERAAHEMIHFKSTSFYRYDKNTGTWDITNVGMHTATNKGLAFRLLNEAVTQELAIRSIKDYFPEEGEYFKKIADSFESITGDWTSAPESNERHGYHGERLALEGLILKLHFLNRDKFANEQEIFDIFARAALTGRKLEVGRLIERTFGKGSFRKLGTAANKNEFIRTVLSLGIEKLEARLQSLLQQKIETPSEIDGQPNPEYRSIENDCDLIRDMLYKM